MENETIARIVFIMAGGVLFVLYILAIRWVIVRLMNMQSRDRRRMKRWDRSFNYLERRCEELANGLDILEKEQIENRTELVRFGYFIAGISSDRAKWIKEGNNPVCYIPSSEFWDNFFYYIHLNCKDEKTTQSNIVPGQSAQGL